MKITIVSYENKYSEEKRQLAIHINNNQPNKHKPVRNTSTSTGPKTSRRLLANNQVQLAREMSTSNI